MARSQEELRKMNEIDPEYKEVMTPIISDHHDAEQQQAIKNSPMPDMGKDFYTRRARRAAHLADLRHLYPIPGPIPEVQERGTRLTMRDGATIMVHIYTPQASLVPSNGSPLYVAFHEGGWSMGDLTDEEMNCRMVSKELGAVSVNVEYRLAPEHPFPTGINDCWDTLKWLAHNAASLGANPKAGFIVGGASAGGNLSAVVAHIARDEKLDPPLTGQYLCVPAVIPPISVPEKYRTEYISPQENTNDPVLQLSPGDKLYEGLEKILKMDISSPLFNPMKNPNGHRGLPRAYFQISGLDPLRDEGLIYEQVLSENGVETKLDLYPGFGHMFWTNYPRMEKSKQFVKDTLEGIRWLLNAGTG